MQNERAFTLIELLVVVLIIGILTAVAVPQYQLAVKKTKMVQLKALVNSIQKAEEEIFMANGVYLLDPEVLSISLPTPKGTSSNTQVYTLTYPWGFCRILKDSALCEDNELALYYEHYYDHSRKPGLKNCVARQNNEQAIKICKQETGKDSPNSWPGQDTYYPFSY